MALSLRQIKTRIRGIENVSKITHAMEMISIVKLKPAQNQLIPLRRYVFRIEALLKSLLGSAQGFSHPLIKKSAEIKKRLLCVITSDTGLCSTYNNNVIRAAENFINQCGSNDVILITVGRKGWNYFKKKGMEIAYTYLDFHGRYSQDKAGEILQNLERLFVCGVAAEVHIAYARFESSSRYTAIIEKFLNIDADFVGSEEYIFEPPSNVILNELLPVYISSKLKLIMLNAFVSEHASRAIAMGEATENAKELLTDLTLLRNKLRQANITREIIEVVSSAEVVR